MRASDPELLRFLTSSPAVRTGKFRAPADENRAASCFGVAVYLDLVTGRSSEDESDRLLDHAAVCDACAQLLAESLKTLDGQPDAEESAAIVELASRQDWQRELAANAASSSARKPAPSFLPRLPSRRWRAAGAAAAVLLAAGASIAGSLFMRHRRASTPEYQLAAAYVQSRTLELRIPDADYASLTSGHHTRGALADQESAPLLEARARLARELERTPEDIHWLGLQARADLLEERYDSTIETLDRLIALGPASAEMLTDAASAYFERGLVSGSELDRSTALDYLRRADKLAPADPVILFNEAIVMEDRGQMMNAVEVWNRYVAVERDPKWAAEGKRKMAALEVSLNRLKTHQSRLMQNLASPQAMDALARDAPKLASLDEELTSIELDKLMPIAFPLAVDAGENDNGGTGAVGIGQARGSPCLESCEAARRLLKALALSLEQHHNDYWLSELLSPEIHFLPEKVQLDYSRAMRLLAQAMREDQTGLPTDGSRMALEARTIFGRLGAHESKATAMRVAARVGGERAEVEYLFGLERSEDFRACRDYVKQLHVGGAGQTKSVRYPWIEAVEAITEKSCNDTPETRSASNALQAKALKLAEAAHYPWLLSRIHLRDADDPEARGDLETASRITLETLRDLLAKDSPAIRIANTIPLTNEDNYSRSHAAELSLKESLGWWQLTGSPFRTAYVHLALMRTEMRLDNIQESEHQHSLANHDFSSFGQVSFGGDLMAEEEIFLADAMLERQNLAGASKYLSLASQDIGKYSDNWGLRTYASALGMLELEEGQPTSAAEVLQKQILYSEGKPALREAPQGDENVRLDHDLYAELVAAWLAQSRKPEQVLALWERFRLRSRGLQTATCLDNALDCDTGKLLTAQSQLGGNVLIGQIVLLDRVLVYSMDRQKIQWTQRKLQRQDLLAGATVFEQSLSSPHSTLDFTKRLGARLSDALLPALPVSIGDDSALLLEPDPALQNLAWPLLPTPAGPLGLSYPLTEARSILIPNNRFDLASSGKGELIVGASLPSGIEEPLPEALVEAQKVARFVDAPDVLLGDHATSDQVAESLGSVRLFHFAGHAIRGADGTELLLASSSHSKTKPDLQPWIDDAFLHKHPPRACRLAVLSACGTGVEEAASGLPLQTMVETLSSLGVPQVVATRWAVDSQSSVAFMDAFYQSLGKGHSVAVALRSARQSVAAQPQYNNPYYWGAYYATGEANTNLNGVLHASR